VAVEAKAPVHRPSDGIGRHAAKLGHPRVAASFPHCGHFDSKAGMRYVMDV